MIKPGWTGKVMSPLVVLLYPGIQLADFPLSKYLDTAVILVAHGCGNGPGAQAGEVKKYLDGGGLVAVVTECLLGATAGHYAASVAKWDTRIASCANTTLASAVAKVTVLLGNSKLHPLQDQCPERQDQINKTRQDFFNTSMARSLAGELVYDSLAEYCQANSDPSPSRSSTTPPAPQPGPSPSSAGAA